MRFRNILRSAAAGILSASIVSGQAVYAQTINPEEIITDSLDQIRVAAEKLDMPEFEGNVTVTAADGMRDAIAEHYRSQEDMSWINNAGILLQGSSVEADRENLEATFEFNDTELYHLQASYAPASNTIYLICPELKDEVIEFPIANFTSDPHAWTRKKVTAQMMAEAMSLFQELNDLISSISLEQLQAEVMKYYAALQSYVKVESGFTTVQAGTLTAEGTTTSFSVSAADMQEAIPIALNMLAEDELLKQILKSDFADHVFSLVMRSTAGNIELPKGALWQFTQQLIAKAAQKEYKNLSGITVTFAFDQKGRPIQAAAFMEQSGMKADLIQVNAVLNGSAHAFEVKAGPVLVRKFGIKSTMSSGLLLQGTLSDSYLKETVSMIFNGEVIPLFRIDDLDLLSFEHVWPSGVFTLIWGDKEYSCDFHMNEEGVRTMVFSVNDKEWFTLTAELKEVESTSLDKMDIDGAFVVDSRTAFEAYMRDASALNMFEKLSKAGVPQEYVDMLTDGEAATESSRENKEERN